jgi:hypothetical protein
LAKNYQNKTKTMERPKASNWLRIGSEIDLFDTT